MGERAWNLIGVLVALIALGASPAAASDIGPPGPPVTAPPAGPVAGARAISAPAASGDPLSGLFGISAGSCESKPMGSMFRMIQPGGSATGPYVTNSDSPCGDQTFTPLAPGTDGGLSTIAYQPNPDPAFDAGGNGRAAAIIKPQKFFGVAFAMSTNDKDPQTGATVDKPVVTSSGGQLSGDLRAVSVAYNTQHFNQGSPKPNGSRPGVTAGPTGAYDATTGAYTLDWASTIMGGPFNGFTGMWHLEGTFRASAQDTSTSTPAAPAPTDGGGPASATAVSTADPSAAPTAPASGGPAATHPRTGWSLPGSRTLVLLLVGLAGLAVRRLVVDVVTNEPGRGSGRGGPAGDRVRRP